MYVGNLAVVIILLLPLTTVIHPLSPFSCPPHRQLSFFSSFCLCFGHCSSLPFVNSLPSMNFNFIFLHTLLNLNILCFLFHMHVSGVMFAGCFLRSYFLQFLQVTGTTVSSSLDVSRCWLLHCSCCWSVLSLSYLSYHGDVGAPPPSCIPPVNC